MNKILLFFVIALLSASCSKSYLSVHTDYLSHENLASYHVGTPDPMLNNPPVGQRLLISWCFPSSFLNYEDLHLQVQIRFRNSQEITFNICPKNSVGTYIYALMNKDYFDVDGIQTYKVELIGSDCVLEEWRHQIWTELITFEEKDEEEQDDELDEGMSQ